MKWKIYIVVVLGAVSLMYTSCKDEDPQVTTTTPYELDLPENFPSLYIHPENPMTVEGVELGRMLFYDNMLSQNNDRACADCHDQGSAFTTEASNALAHINLGWAEHYLWKGEVTGSLEDIMEFEVADFFMADLDRFNADPYYKDAFKKAFGVDQITVRELSFALAQFERTLISADSKYDRFLRDEVSFTEEERRGWIYFNTEQGDCFHCHGGLLFTDNEFHNTGLDSLPEDGRMEYTGNPLDKGKFKTPTLRNIALTGPYMHDGRFKTLEEVIRFYSTGVHYSPTIDPLMKQVDQGGVQFTEEQIQDMIAFLHTLTDTTFINNPALSRPE